MSLLSIQDLSLSIHGIPILKDVSFEIAQGEVCGVIGESGSGKSMTALSVMQLLPQGGEASGRITLAGTDVLGACESALCDMRGNGVGMVFQEPMTALNPVQTIGQQVAETVMIHQRVSRAEAMRRAAETLERCELPNDRFPLTRYPHELSGGQRQRVVIAMAIALRPDLLIADEPTTALDVTTQAEILNLLRTLVKEDGMGCMLITHDLAVVAGIADRMVIMKNGEVVEKAAAGDFPRNMRHPYTKALFAASSHQPERAGGTKEKRASVSQRCRTGLSGSAPVAFREAGDIPGRRPCQLRSDPRRMPGVGGGKRLWEVDADAGNSGPRHGTGWRDPVERGQRS